MSLYYEAAPLLVSVSGSEGSLKSRIFGSKDLKSQPKQLYALVSEAAKWSPILSDVIEKSQLLRLERKLSPNLALLLVHDLLLAKKGISAGTSHPLRAIVERHKARLNAELTKVRLKRGFASLEGLRTHINAGNLRIEDEKKERLPSSDKAVEFAVDSWPHPRWVRINTLKTDLGEQMRTTFAAYKSVDTIDELLNVPVQSTEKLIHIDKHIPNLVALPSNTDLIKTSAYNNGLIIFQDKASCFPAYLLDPKPEGGYILDACAAPGNKTTHLAALLQEKIDTAQGVTIHACERDNARAVTLEQMVQTAGASRLVTINKGQDFLRTEPHQAPWNKVGSLLLDPSCTGSGIVGRDEMLKIMLPNKPIIEPSKHRSKKRKRETVEISIPELQEIQGEVAINEDKAPNQSFDRFPALCAFQLKLLLHAFRFPKAQRITYSTCSIYAEENEQVVVKALNSEDAKTHSWRLMPRDQQVLGMKGWQIRGDPECCKDAETIDNMDRIAEACIRCEKGTREGTQGFFVAAFVRDDRSDVVEAAPEEEWEGFSDD